eukprot:1858881-Pleurochrysis_carterae.AAC.1
MSMSMSLSLSLSRSLPPFLPLPLPPPLLLPLPLPLPLPPSLPPSLSQRHTSSFSLPASAIDGEWLTSTSIASPSELSITSKPSTWKDRRWRKTGRERGRGSG